MSRPEEAAAELDALLATPTPAPEEAAPPDDEGGRAGQPERASRPARGRLEAWLRGGVDAEADESTAPAPGEESRQEGDRDRSVTPGVVDQGQDPAQPAPVEVESIGVLRSIPIDAVDPSSYQPRRHFDEASLASLAASVEAVGVLQPVLVRAVGDDRYELVAGERRWRAAQLAGMRMIPALVREVSDQGTLEQAIVENLHRQDLNALEEAAAYQELTDDFGLTQDEVARRVGKSRSAVTNTLRLLQLPAVVQRLVVQGLLSAGHARALLAVGEREAQVNLAERIVTEQLNVRQTEEAVRSWSAGASDGGVGRGATGGRATGSAGERGPRSVGALEVQSLLEERLETRIDVQEAERGGRLVIRFADEEDLGRISRLLLGDE